MTTNDDEEATGERDWESGRERQKEGNEVTRERERERNISSKTRRSVFLQFLSAKRLTANRIHVLVREECFIFPLYARHMYA